MLEIVRLVVYLFMWFDIVLIIEVILTIRNYDCYKGKGRVFIKVKVLNFSKVVVLSSILFDLIKENFNLSKDSLMHVYVIVFHKEQQLKKINVLHNYRNMLRLVIHFKVVVVIFGGLCKYKRKNFSKIGVFLFWNK